MVILKNHCGDNIEPTSKDNSEYCLTLGALLQCSIVSPFFFLLLQCIGTMEKKKALWLDKVQCIQMLHKLQQLPLLLSINLSMMPPDESKI